MQNKEISLHIINDLQEANKYIFVQDFVKADEILKKICKKNHNAYEAYFKRIEIASKNNTLDKLLSELSSQEKSDAAELAYLLAKVKKYSLANKANATKNMSGIHLDIFPSRKEKVIRLPNKKLKIERTLSFPDDMVEPVKSNELDINQTFELSYFNEVVEQIFTYYKNNPDNYAACYVAGCAMENIGNLPEAVHTWKKGLNLNPYSICTLSILAELQQQGHFHEQTEDFCLKLESLDKYLVHGHIETHTDLYNEFINLKDYKNSISSLKILFDWIFRQYGNVPIEIEVICLLGSMNAYKLDNNAMAAESCKNEVENLVIAYKKSTHDLTHLVFIAELCEEYELKSLAKICYFSILAAKNTPIDIIKKVASHCVHFYASEALLNNLRIAYENNHGNSEIKFCILVCLLDIKQVNFTEYMQNKNVARELISQQKNEEAALILEKILSKFNDDPEIHYYLAEIFSRKNLISKAQIHFQSMYNVDAYNYETTLKYIYFLLKNKFFAEAIIVCKNTLSLNILSPAHTNEIHWSLAAGYFAGEEYELAKEEISKTMSHDPWNSSYITLYLRCCIHLTDTSPIPDTFFLISKLEELTISQGKIEAEKKENLLQTLVEYSLLCLKNGHFELAWAFAKCCLVVNKKLDEKISFVLAKTAAAYLSPITIPQLLILINKQTEFEISFFEIAACIAHTYELTGQWQIVSEWVAMAKNNPFATKLSKAQLFELDALSMTMQGASDLKKIQILLEAAFDCYEYPEQAPAETTILYGYILVNQGKIGEGIEKMRSHINSESSIQSLYFFIKGLERADALSSLSKEAIKQMSTLYPLNSFEQKMMEEIFYTVSSKINFIPMGLAC